MISERTAKFGQAAFFIGLVNFTVFFVLALALGGDAVNGHEAGGRFYLANHGKLTEVSRVVFTYSRLHTFSVMITHPLAILGGWLHNRWRNQNEVSGWP